MLRWCYRTNLNETPNSDVHRAKYRTECKVDDLKMVSAVHTWDRIVFSSLLQIFCITTNNFGELKLLLKWEQESLPENAID